MAERSLSLSLTFAWQIANHPNGKANLATCRAKNFALVGKCTVAVRALSAVLEYWVPERWWEQAPIFRCRSPWFRKNIDWHTNEEGFMCWTHSKLWRDGFAELLSAGNPVENILPLASQLCARDVARLLGYHAIADELRLTRWQSEWPQWSHHEAGTAEYEREKKRLLGRFP